MKHIEETQKGVYVPLNVEFLKQNIINKINERKNT